MLGVWATAGIEENSIWKSNWGPCDVCNQNQYFYRIEFLMSEHVECSCISCGEVIYWYKDKFLENHTRVDVVDLGENVDNSICDCDTQVLANRGCICGHLSGTKKVV